MWNIQIQPEKILEELATFGRKLTNGVETLGRIGEIPTGVTPKEVVFNEDQLQLYRYQSFGDAQENRIPLLIVYALVNRPYMIDLSENRSMTRRLIDASLNVYLIDWGYPNRADRYLTLDDYISGYIDQCVDTVRKLHGVDRVNILGICQGGTLSLCYSALYPKKVKNLITMVTPVDFHVPEFLLSKWAHYIDIDQMVDTLGNISGEALNAMFLTLKPFRLTGQKYLDMLDLFDNPQQLENFMRMEKWIFDSPDLAGEAYREFAKYFFQQNALIEGKLMIGGRGVHLKNVTLPVLNVYATQDDIVPPDSSKALKKHLGSRDYTERAFPTGHIGIYVGSKARDVPSSVGQWLNVRKRA